MSRMRAASFTLLIDFGLGNLSQLQTKSHVIIYGHMRIQSVVLENHRDVSVLRSYIVHQLAVNIKLTVA